LGNWGWCPKLNFSAPPPPSFTEQRPNFSFFEPVS